MGWFKDGSPVTNGADYTIDNTKSAELKSTLKLTAEQSKTERNGVYKCKVTFATVGFHEAEMTLYIQSATATAAKTYSAPGADVTLSCVFYGNLKTATEWFKGKTSTIRNFRLLHFCVFL